MRPPNTPYLVDRKIIFDMYLMHPWGKGGKVDAFTKLMVGLIGFLLAAGAKKYKVTLSAAFFHSNHFHLVLHDHLGNLSDFMRWFNSLLARGLNFYLGRKGKFFDERKYGATMLMSKEAGINKVVYVKNQAVKDDVVYKRHHWVGFHSDVHDLLKPKTYRRDETFFRTVPEGGELPQTAELTFEKLPMFAEMSDSDYVSMVAEALEANDREIAARPDRKVCGLRQVRQIPRGYMPSMKKRLPRKKRIETDEDGSEYAAGIEDIKPQFTYRNRREYICFAKRQKAFVRDYRARRMAYLAGDTESPWPHGTFWMVYRMGAVAEPRPPPD